MILGFLIAISVVAPSFKASDLIKTLGVGTVAIGFAFQNILQNFLAGILILVQEPFHIGDLISVTGIEGRVDDIQTRATVITADSGRQVVIPNATLFTNPVAVGQVLTDWAKPKEKKDATTQPQKPGPTQTAPPPVKAERPSSTPQPSEEETELRPRQEPQPDR